MVAMLAVDSAVEIAFFEMASFIAESVKIQVIFLEVKLEIEGGWWDAERCWKACWFGNGGRCRSKKRDKYEDSLVRDQ